MTGWQDSDNGDPTLDGWYAILISWGTPWEEDTPDVLRFKDGAWIKKQEDCSLPNFNYFQGPFQSPTEARDWGYANDPVSKYLAERDKTARSTPEARLVEELDAVRKAFVWECDVGKLLAIADELEAQ